MHYYYRMPLKCGMWLAITILTCSCGIRAVFPTRTDSYERLPTPSTLSIDSHDATINSSLKPPSSVTKWKCPVISNIPGVICGCDVPHTIRCRGDAIATLTPKLLLDLTSDLRLVRQPGATISLLDLSLRGVNHLPARVFEGLDLFGLIISASELETFDDDAFVGLENHLAALGIPENVITTVPTRALRNLRILQRLDLSDNQFERLTSHAFPTLLQLQMLNLDNNKIQIIEPEAFVRLPQLKILMLSNNQLDTSQFNNKTLRGLHFLSKLSMQSNLLKGTLTQDFLEAAPKLRFLDLSHNAFTKIAFGALKRCVQLNNLDLSHNQIDVIEDHAFKYLTQLRDLQLSHNRIVSVSGWSMAHLPNLATVSLADNALLAVTADLLHQLPNVTSIDLSANDISLLQPYVFNYTPNIQIFSLADNPLHCDCKLTWLQTWLKQQANLTVDDKRSVVCATPPNLENIELVDVKTSSLVCSAVDATDYYQDEGDYYAEGTDELRVSDAEVSLLEASWVSEDTNVQLVWRVDDRALPYRCHAIYIYEMETVQGAVHQVLAENLNVNCSSEAQRDPHQVVVTIPGSVLQPGQRYRYCLILLEKGTNDHEDLLPGCSEALPLDPPSKKNILLHKPLEVTSLTAGIQGASLVVQTRFTESQDPCFYRIYVLADQSVAASEKLNCSQPRRTFHSLEERKYAVCVNPDMKDHPSLEDLQQMLKNAVNVTEFLHEKFAACTTVLLRYNSAVNLSEDANTRWWQSGPLLTLIFTVPGIALIVAIYVIGRRVWRSGAGGGGGPWRWDPRASKGAKYLLYTGETDTPTVSLDPLPQPVPESSV